MARSKRPTCPPELILDGHAPEVVATAHALRQLVRDFAPDIVEAGYPGWRLIGLRRHGYLGFIAPQRDHVRLGFERGVSLPDPDGVLEGAGNQVRYVVIRSAEEIRPDVLRRLLGAALVEDEQRADVRALRRR